MDIRKIIFSVAFIISATALFAQVENAGSVRKRSTQENPSRVSDGNVSDRMHSLFETHETHEADLDFVRHIYRRLDLSKEKNAPLYFPEDVVDGQENLFRIIFRLVTDGRIPAYEYLDGREDFSDKFRINIPEMLKRFDIYAREGKGSTEKNPRFVIEEADVPTSLVKNYYIIEKWEFDHRTNRMKTIVEAICPVMSRTGDFGDEARYPMFWIKFDLLRPYLAGQTVFISDDNNLARFSLDDFFSLNKYEGEIYKTKNLRNLSMAQMFPDEDDRKRASDSIDHRLRTYGKNLWVPTREEYLSVKEKQAAQKTTSASEDSIPDRTVVEVKSAHADKSSSSVRAKKRKTTKKTSKSTVKSSSGNTSAAKSVRRRKR